jgi:hypothetical protein
MPFKDRKKYENAFGGLTTPIDEFVAYFRAMATGRVPEPKGV